MWSSSVLRGFRVNAKPHTLGTNVNTRLRLRVSRVTGKGCTRTKATQSSNVQLNGNAADGNAQVAKPASNHANTIATVAVAEPDAMTQVNLDTAWVMICAYLVVFMNAGFACLESGFCRAKNTVNIFAKNMIVFALAVAVYYFVGFGFMFGDGNAYIGLSGFAPASLADNAVESVLTGVKYTGAYSAMADTAIPLATKFFFQAAFAATTCSIVSGAVAERIKIHAFFLFAILMVGSIYGIMGHWIWGGGWLAAMGFEDFAGGTAVHALGGWAALTGAKILGPRIGKYGADAKDFAPHSFPIASLGCFILWLGWFGFNPGSTLAADGPSISHIALATNLGGLAGALGATAVEWFKNKKFVIDQGQIVNGLLGGLVGVTAAVPFLSIRSAMVVGLIAGALVAPFTDFVDKVLKVDDPIGAIPVHLGTGTFGTLCVGLFAEGPGALYAEGPAKGLLLGGGPEQFFIQLLGAVTCGVFAIVVCSALWMVVKAVMGLRVSTEEEIAGLDLSEHDQVAYTLVEEEPPKQGNISAPSNTVKNEQIPVSVT